MICAWLRKGLCFRLTGRDCVIKERLSNGDLRIKDSASGDCFVRSNGQLLEALADGQLDFSENTWREAAERRLSYVSEISNRGLTSLTVDLLRPLISDVAHAIGDPAAPSWRTVVRWYIGYNSSCEGIRSLLPFSQMSPGRSDVGDPAVRLIFDMGRGTSPIKKGDS